MTRYSFICEFKFQWSSPLDTRDNHHLICPQIMPADQRDVYRSFRSTTPSLETRTHICHTHISTRFGIRYKLTLDPNYSCVWSGRRREKWCIKRNDWTWRNPCPRIREVRERAKWKEENIHILLILTACMCVTEQQQRQQLENKKNRFTQRCLKVTHIRESNERQKYPKFRSHDNRTCTLFWTGTNIHNKHTHIILFLPFEEPVIKE